MEVHEKASKEQLHPVGHGISPALGCSPWAEAHEGHLEDLSMGESFLLACSDLWLAHALKHKHLYPDLYFNLSKGSCKCSHYYLCKCLILSLHPPRALGTGDIL